MTMDQAHLETLGIAAAGDKLGSLVSRAVHAHRPTRIRRSADEHAVLISDDDYAEYLALKREREADQVAALIAATSSERIEEQAYASREQAYADLDLDAAR
ncbi:prevent-host-death family protein [Nonomuraea sp. NPDC050663]|uniref:prevent-host-death family protein n=1 Tax=Nonomuraea sp. NPDC050663 TaxID=3364370 RepID=UPI0037AFDC69